MSIRLAALGAFAFGALMPGAAPAAPASIPSGAIAITASNYKFAPGTITVKAGQPVTLALSSAGGVHGIQSSDLGIKQTMITPGGEVKIVTFTPSKAGKYQVHCSVPCGPGHADMVLTVIVQ
ncbi:MAG: cupredoxin domain-containing protein [Candidatus Eremiobacteraeota bacterium]|nr:cupredoxin domain-containing protein [Candidatus Eremiobacteraeota bacterium]